ncbi:hypothetical protein D3C73_981320 [compost metagenome]
MQTQHLIIIATCATLGLLLMGLYIRKLILLAFDRHYAAGVRDHKMEHGRRIAALNADLATLTQLRTHEAQQLVALRKRMLDIKATPFTSSDYRDLMEITQFLALALQTWKALPGTESSQAKAKQLIKLSRAMAHRVFYTAEAATNLNGQPLDTQLIEWLDKRGDLWGDIEQSTIRFPHQADTAGYHHLRAALREAYELDIKQQAIELGKLPAEDAA